MDFFIFISARKGGHIIKYPLTNLICLRSENIVYFEKYPCFY